MHGVLPVSKPTGISSYDVIRRLKSFVTRQTAIGHAGTLDPLATGVLVVLMGDATKLSGLLMSGDKDYEAGVRLGVETDTDDITGAVLNQTPLGSLSTSDIEAVLTRFVGTVRQVPPRYSAIKQSGQPLYRLARAGEEFTPPTRTVTISRLTLISWKPPVVTVGCTVSAGTYVRSLARDIGRALGPGATVESLIRTRSGGFHIDRTTSLDELNATSIGARLIPITEALKYVIPQVDVDAENATRLSQGQSINIGGTAEGIVLAKTPTGDFLALVRVSDGRASPERIICVN